MRWIPYFKKKYETPLSEKMIFERLEKVISHPDWNFSVDKAANNQVMEGVLGDHLFTLVMGKYASTYGRTSMLPIMKGRIEYDHGKLQTIVHIAIHPPGWAVFLLSPVYCLLLYVLVQGIRDRNVGQFFPGCIFLIVTYCLLITKYNKEKINYIELLENKILK